jgi:hypothetical protein
MFVNRQTAFLWLPPVVLFLSTCSYDADVMQWLLGRNDMKLARSFNASRSVIYIVDDVLSLNNSKFDDHLISSISMNLKYRIPQI